ncbi:MAG: hypothetical protein JKY93_00640, partial [Gammaproteobacteria bacterium]|nr:hypothetical protein [Gammaproteobacteria bacterium]
MQTESEVDVWTKVASNSDDSPETAYQYNVVGQLIAQKDANGNVNKMSYAAGQVANEFQADGGVRYTKYDALGQVRLTGSLQSAGNSNTYLEKSFDYQYNADEVVVTTTGAGIVDSIERTYDSDGDLLQDKKSVHLTNDDFQNGISTTVTTDYQYDDFGRLTSVVSYQNTNTLNTFGDTSYGYEDITSGLAEGGVRKTTTYEDGRTLIEEFDFFGRLLQKTDMGEHVVDYEYNQSGWLIREFGTVGSTKDINYRYFSTGNISAIDDLSINSDSTLAN